MAEKSMAEMKNTVPLHGEMRDKTHMHGERRKRDDVGEKTPQGLVSGEKTAGKFRIRSATWPSTRPARPRRHTRGRPITSAR